MRNTALDTINNGISNRIVDVPVVSRPDRWKALPLLILMFSTGLPLNYKLQLTRPITVADAAELTMSAASGANAASSMFFVIFLGALYFFAGAMLLKKPKATATILQQQWPLCLLLLLIAVSVAWSNEQAKVMMNIVHNLGIAMIAVAAAMHYRHDPWSFPRHLGYVLGVNMMLHVLAVVLFPAYTIDWENRWQGLTTHPNTLGAMAFTTLWANASVLICNKAKKPFLHLLFSLAAIIAVVGADSVTSMLTSLLAVVLIYMLNGLNKRGVGQEFYVGTFVIISIFVLMFIMMKSAFDLSGIFQFFGRDSNFTGRTTVWDDAFKAIAERPFLGWSFDDHAYLIQKGMPYPSYHNGFLDLAVSGGVIAIALLVLLLIKWAVGFTKTSRVGKQIAPFSASFVIAYIVHNQTEASLVSPRGQMWQIFLVLILLGACRIWHVPKASHEQHGQQGLPPLHIDTMIDYRSPETPRIGSTG